MCFLDWTERLRSELISHSSGAWFNDSLQDYVHDTALASAMLDDASYLDRDGDGVREMPDGKPLILRMNWPKRAT